MKIEITNVGGDCIEMKIKGDGINTFYTMIPTQRTVYSFEVKNGRVRSRTIKKEIYEENEKTIAKIRSTILRKVKKGEVFYPSNIASIYGFSLQQTMEVIEELTKEGKIADFKAWDKQYCKNCCKEKDGVVTRSGQFRCNGCGWYLEVRSDCVFGGGSKVNA